MKRDVLRPLTRKLDRGMYPEQFHLLEVGDIIRGSKPNGALRTIAEATKFNGKTKTIKLLKVRPSGYPNPYTYYCTTDAHMFVPIKVKNDHIWDFTYEKVQGRRKQDYKRHIERMQQQLRAKLKRYETMG